MASYQSPTIETVGPASKLIQMKTVRPSDPSGVGLMVLALSTPLEADD